MTSEYEWAGRVLVVRSAVVRELVLRPRSSEIVCLIECSIEMLLLMVAVPYFSCLWDVGITLKLIKAYCFWLTM